MARDEVVSSNAILEWRLLDLKEYILTMHAKDFHQALFLYEVSLDDNQFDLGKDTYQGQLMVIEDIPIGGSLAEEEAVKEEPMLLCKDAKENVD